ncbi:MAG: hypothetical protein ABSE49_30455 [Polyangiaceae bacterium]|jgi:hypothetical protein
MPNNKKNATSSKSSIQNTNSQTVTPPPATVPAASPPPAPATATPPAPPASPLAAPPAGAPAAPDPNAALEQYVQQTIAALDAVEVGLGADPALTPNEKRHALKFRKGGDKIVGQIGNLAQQEQVDSAGLSVGDMEAMLGKAHALQPLFDRLAAFSKHVADVIFTSASGSMAMAQQFYALLQRRAKTDNELATAMAPVVTFFARKPAPKAPGGLTKPQKKATSKAVKQLKKTAPEMLQGAAGTVASGVGATAAGATASGAPATGAGAPAASASGQGVTAPSAGQGNGAAAPAAPGGVAHS